MDVDGSYEFCPTKKNQDLPIPRRKSAAVSGPKKNEKVGSKNVTFGGVNTQSKYWTEAFSGPAERSAGDENADDEDDKISFEPQNVRK